MKTSMRVMHQPYVLGASTAVAIGLLLWAAVSALIPASAIPIMIGAGMLTVRVAAATSPRGQREWLTWTVALTFVVHAAVAVAVYAWVVDQIGRPVLFPDEGAYDLYSSVFMDTIRNGQMPDFRAGNPGYFAIVTATYLAWGHDPFFPRIINLTISALLLVPVFGLAQSLFGDVVARRSTLLVAFSPVFLVLPAFMIKDLYVALLVVFVAWQWLKLPRDRPVGRHALAIVAGLALLFTLRPQTAAVMFVVPGVWYVLGGLGPVRWARPVAILAGLGALGLVLTEAFGISHVIDSLAGYAAIGRQAIVDRAAEGSFIGAFVLSGSLLERVALLPAFMLQPLIQPIPNFVDELATLMAPGMIFLYVAYFFVIVGFALMVRREPRRTFVVWGTVAILLLASYVSLFISFRYRIQYEPLLLSMAAVGYTERGAIPGWAASAYVIGVTTLVTGYLALKAIGVG